jgi:hypothetical protein
MPDEIPMIRSGSSMRLLEFSRHCEHHRLGITEPSCAHGHVARAVRRTSRTATGITEAAAVVF